MPLLIRQVICLFMLAAAALGAGPLHAQMSEETVTQLPPEQRQRLQAILDEPVEPGLSNLRLVDVYARKSNAALVLGNTAERERYLREWARLDSSGKRQLRSALSGTDKHEEALALGEELVRSGGGLLPLLDVRVNLARDYSLVGRLAEARTHVDAAESMVRGELTRLSLAGDNLYYVRRIQSLFHGTKSLLLRLSGQWAEGIAQARLAVERARELLELRGQVRNEGARTEAIAVVIRAHIDLARLQTDAGLYADAEWTLREAFRIARKTEIEEARLWPLYRFVAEHYAASGQFADALTFVDRAVAVSEAQGHTRVSSIRRALETIRMQALIGLSRWDEAARVVAELDAAQAARGQEVSLNVIEVRVRVMVALRTGNFEKALALLAPSLARDEKMLGPDHYFTALERGQVAVVLARQGQAEEARAQFARAVRGLTAPASLTGDFSENAFQRQTKRFILQSYMQLLAAGAKDNPQDAVALFEVADLLTSSSVQQALAEAAVRSGVSQPALAEIIRKEQDAKQEIAALSAYLSGQGAGETQRQSAQAAEQMRGRIRELEAQRRGYKAQIQKDFPDYFALVQPRSPSPAEIGKQLRPGELFLAVTPMADTTYVWAIDAQGQVAFHDAGLGEAPLGALVDKVRRTLDIAGFENGRIPAFAFGEASQIYQTIFAPFDAQIAGKRQLIVATGGALAQLPFAVLPRQAHQGSLADAPWLLKDVAVSHVPSANGWLALKRLQQVPAASEPFMAWGDPIFDIKKTTSGLGGGLLLASASQAAPTSDTPMTWPRLEASAGSSSNAGTASAASAGPQSLLRQVAKPAAGAPVQRNVTEADHYVVYSQLQALPETRDEVQALARILGADPARDLVLGNKATRQSVLEASKAGTLAKKRVVVFATHGLLAGDLPNLNQPALAMAANAEANASPLLTLEDVLGLKLNADWVVLSACNTAGADGRAQEAMSGLARGFFYAGSRSLLVTHWSVESQSAMLLTTNTFEAYATDPAITRAEALRQAMLKVMASKDYQHPAFWAPYALVGEGGR